MGQTLKHARIVSFGIENHHHHHHHRHHRHHHHDIVAETHLQMGQEMMQGRGAF